MKVGRTMKFWFDGGLEDGKSRVLKVEEYTGLYKNYFKKVLRVTAKHTSKGWVEIAV